MCRKVAVFAMFLVLVFILCTFGVQVSLKFRTKGIDLGFGIGAFGLGCKL